MHDTLLHDEDIPAMSLWQSLRFVLASESPRMSELRLGVWTCLYGLIIAFGHVFALSPLMYAWIAFVPAPWVGLPMAVMGAYQVVGVLSRSTPRRLWAARLQVILSMTFAIGCTASAGFAAPAWAGFGLNALMSVWCLYRLAPSRARD